MGYCLASLKMRLLVTGWFAAGFRSVVVADDDTDVESGRPDGGTDAVVQG